MLHALGLLLMISQPASEEAADPPETPDKPAERVIREVIEAQDALPYLTDITLAPPVFTWPEDLPEPFSYTLEDGSHGTAFPHPTDIALKLYGLWCDYIPDESQRRIDSAYAQLAELRAETEGVLGYTPPDITEGWATWEVFVLIGGAVVLAAGLSFGAGYLMGVSR